MFTVHRVISLPTYPWSILGITVTGIILPLLLVSDNTDLYDERFNPITTIGYTNKHTHETTCTICYEDFQEGAIVNELKCDAKHFFHN